MTIKEIQKHLFDLQDLKYKDFQCKLMPGVDTDAVIGVRTPELRKLAKEIFKEGDYKDFIHTLPHDYYDEMNLHGFIICQLKDYDQVIELIDAYLPHVNNWATCDLVDPKKAFKKNTDCLIKDIRRWMDSSETYTIRFGIEMLMAYFLDDLFEPEYLSWVADISSEEYYVNMMKAWYMSTALAKQYEATVPYIEEHRLDDWTHKKSIQKAVESYRITDEQKVYLKSFR